MLERLLAVSLILLAVSGCESPPDRIVTSDGEVVIGKLESLSNGVARIAGTEIPVPREPARVWGRNGASHYGAVEVEGGTLLVRTTAGTVEMPLKGASVILWGETSVESRVFDVPAGSGWICTHVLVEPGDYITVSAGGNAYTELGPSEPDGIDEFSSATALAPQAVGASLVMRIGPDGDVVQVGSRWSGNAAAAGEIYLAINTHPERAGTAHGRYTATLSTGPGPGRGMTAVFPGGRGRFPL